MGVAAGALGVSLLAILVAVWAAREAHRQADAAKRSAIAAEGARVAAEQMATIETKRHRLEQRPLLDVKVLDGAEHLRLTLKIRNPGPADLDDLRLECDGVTFAVGEVAGGELGRFPSDAVGMVEVWRESSGPMEVDAMARCVADGDRWSQPIELVFGPWIGVV